MTEERPGGERPESEEPRRDDAAPVTPPAPDAEGTAADGDGLEARDASAPDVAPAPPGLRSASSIFGEANWSQEWPTRRERREAERAAAESGEVPPLPFTLATPSQSEEPAPAPGTPTPPSAPEPIAPPQPPAPSQPSQPEQPIDPPSYEDDATQAVAMQRELDAPNERPDALDLGSRIPPASAVPPASTAPHPLSIQLPSAMSSRDQRAAEARDIDDERRRTDPDGVGRDDVDWLGRATGPVEPLPPVTGGIPAVSGPIAFPQPTGVAGAIPTDEPPSFTDLLRLNGTGSDDSGSPSRGAFDWTATADDDDEPVDPYAVEPAFPVAAAPVTPPAPAVATPPAPELDGTTAFDTTALAGGWSIADEEAEADETVSDSASEAAPFEPASAADAATTALPVPDLVDPEPSSWSLSEEAARTGEIFPGDTMDEPARRASPVAAAPATPVAPESVAPESAAQDVPWWAQSDDTDVPPTAAPPLVDPPAAGHEEYPGGHLPPAVGQDLDALIGIRRDDAVDRPETGPVDAPGADDIDQSEWQGRETSDTRAIDALFGTGAMRHLDGAEPEPELPVGETGTRMMPVVGGAPAEPGTPNDQRRPDGFPFTVPPVSQRSSGDRPSASPAGAPGGNGPTGNAPDERFGRVVNEGFGRLQAEGRRGKQWLIGGAIAIIVVMLVAVFLLTRWIIGGDVQHQPDPSPTKTSASQPRTSSAKPSTAASTTPAPATADFATTPAGAGTHSWRDLAGGECLTDFTSVWAETFTVVDCATAHQAQLTHRGTIDGDYPGAAELAAQMPSLCSSASALSLGAAGAYSDVQVQGAYPATDAEWATGDHFYSCFATRASGEAMTGSLAPTA